LRGRTLGILGYGHIDKVIAGYAKAFEMPVLVSGRGGSRSAAEGDGLAMASDRADFFRRST